MNALLLLDTNVAIDHLRGRPPAVAFLGGLVGRPMTSVVVVAELYAGVREGPERARLETFLAGLVVLPLTADVARAGGLFRRQYGKSHNVGLEDALIAATAEAAGATLVTLNRKHFPMPIDVMVPYPTTTTP